MKIIITSLAIATVALFGAVPKARAGEYYSSSRIYAGNDRACGAPIYSERYFVGRDRCGNPIWGVRPVRQFYRPVVVRPRYIAPCAPAYYPSRSRYVSSHRGSCYGGNGVVIQARFRR